MGKKIPKKIAGVKVPKVLRKNSLLKSLMANAVGRQLVADALIGAATAAAGVLVAQTKSAQQAGKAVEHTAEDGMEVARRAFKSAAAAITDSLGKAAHSALGFDETRSSQRAGSRPH